MGGPLCSPSPPVSRLSSSLSSSLWSLSFSSRPPGNYSEVILQVVFIPFFIPFFHSHLSFSLPAALLSAPAPNEFCENTTGGPFFVAPIKTKQTAEDPAVLCGSLKGHWDTHMDSLCKDLLFFPSHTCLIKLSYRDWCEFQWTRS